MVRPQDKKILVIDDEPDVLRYHSTILKDAGFQVVTATDGDEGLEAVREHKPDFISLDLVMPKKSGIRFYHELRRNKEWSRIPVVVVTAHYQDDKIQKDIADGFSDRTISGPEVYLEKPVKPQEYVKMVKKTLGIEVEEQAGGEAAAADSDLLRDRVKGLIENTDRDVLEKMLRLLEERKK